MDPRLPTSRPQGRDAVRQALIAATVALVGRTGVAGTSTRAIAAEAGVNQGLITRHFGSKAALVAAAAQEVAHQLFAEVEDQDLSLEDLIFGPGAGHRQALRVLIRIVLEEDEAPGSLIDPALLERLYRWIGRQEGPGAPDFPQARVFWVAAVLLGTELAAPRVAADLGLDGPGRERLAAEARRFFRHGFVP